MKITPLSLLLALLASASTATAAVFTFSENTFLPSSMANVVVTNGSPGAFAYSNSRITDGGNSGDFSATSIGRAEGRGETECDSVRTWIIRGGTVSLNSAFTPSKQGAILGLDSSYDLIKLSADGSPDMLTSPLIFQNGKYFTISPDAYRSNTWRTVSHQGLTAADFSLIQMNTSELDSAQHPDFSATGSRMIFGFVSEFSDPGDFVVQSGLDNLAFTVHTVPEPTAALTHRRPHPRPRLTRHPPPPPVTWHGLPARKPGRVPCSSSVGPCIDAPRLMGGTPKPQCR